MPLACINVEMTTEPHKLHDRFQFRAPAPRGPRSGLGTDNFATCILEAANLDIQILVRGADAGISDTSQVQNPSH